MRKVVIDGIEMSIASAKQYEKFNAWFEELCKERDREIAAAGGEEAHMKLMANKKVDVPELTPKQKADLELARILWTCTGPGL